LLTDSKDFINKDLSGNNQKTSIVSPNSTVLKDGSDTYLKFISTADNQYWLDYSEISSNNCEKIIYSFNKQSHMLEYNQNISWH
jgi:hypothetical protein